jgi:transglutaminase-like putative cysteine protease
MRGHYYDIVPFWSSWQTLEKVYQTILPSAKLLQYSFYNGEITPVVRNLDGKICYSFCKKNISPLEREPNMVDPFDVAPKLILTTAPDWPSKSRWFYKVNEDYGSFQWTPDIKAKTDEILKGAKDELDSVSRLTHWVADNIRYFGLNMGCGEGYTLHKAEMTFEDRCGVCKDKAGMLVTMLRAAGFEAYAAMTMAGSRIENIPADHFNHSVTASGCQTASFICSILPGYLLSGSFGRAVNNNKTILSEPQKANSCRKFLFLRLKTIILT